jgi:hypothetical protein
VKRRTRLIIKCTATAVIVASVVLSRIVSDDNVPEFGGGQAALFFAFAVASVTLFVFVLFDFDKWVDTVPPVPKRALRRPIGRATRRAGRGIARVLSYFGAALRWVAGGATAGFAWLWAWAVRVAAVALGALVWTLVRAGKGLTVLWAHIVRGGLRALVRYRAAMQWLWSRMAYGLARLGEGLTAVWAWLVRGGLRALVRYRAAMQWVWSRMGHALARLGEMLTLWWAWTARAGAWTLVRSGRGIRRAWLAAVGRGDEPTPRPIRRWYTATVDAAFGIPPDGTSVDVFGGRRAPGGPTDPSGAQRRAEHREEEKVGAASRADAHERNH